MKNVKWILLAIVLIGLVRPGFAAENPASKKPATPEKTSYMPVVDLESFSAMRNRTSEAKAGIMKQQTNLLAERYDLSNRPSKPAVMDRTKPVQEGVRVKLPSSVTWSE